MITNRKSTRHHKKVVITDSLFASYVNAMTEHLLPYQWKVLNDQIPARKSRTALIISGLRRERNGGEPTRARCSGIRTYSKWLETVAFCIANGTGRNT